MEFLGIGPLELFFIVLIALIILGPKDMIKAGRTLGRTMRNIVKSPNWRILQQASKEMKYLPDRLMREAGLEDIKNDLPDLKQLEKEAGLDKIYTEIRDMQNGLSDWTTPPLVSQNTQNNNKTTPNENSAVESKIKQPEEPST
jgi:Sec-independent protein translocase protein TatA